MTKIKMLKFKILVEQNQKDQSKNGIFIPETARQEQTLFTVIDVGEFACNDEVKVGDVIILSKYAGTEVKDNDRFYRIVDEDDVLAKIE